MAEPQRQEPSHAPGDTVQEPPAEVFEITIARAATGIDPSPAGSAGARLRQAFVDSAWSAYLGGLAVGTAVPALLLLLFTGIL